MKKLVLAALLTGVSSAACTTEGEIAVDVTWTFRHLEDMGDSARSCPSGFGTATVLSQQVDAVTHRGNGVTFEDKFDCSAGGGTVFVPDDGGVYLVWVEIESNSGSTPYAQSFSTVVDTLDGDAEVDVKIVDNGGYFFLTWDLEDDVTGQRISCAEAGVDSNGSVEIISTDIASPTDFVTDKFDCDDHYGTTLPLFAGDYTVAVFAEKNNEQLGDAVTKNAEIGAPNKLTDLGNFIIPIE
jgi:hypothetical protein